MPISDDIEEFWKVIRPVRLPPRVVESAPTIEGSSTRDKWYLGYREVFNRSLVRYTHIGTMTRAEVFYDLVHRFLLHWSGVTIVYA